MSEELAQRPSNQREGLPLKGIKYGKFEKKFKKWRRTSHTG